MPLDVVMLELLLGSKGDEAVDAVGLLAGVMPLLHVGAQVPCVLKGSRGRGIWARGIRLLNIMKTPTVNSWFMYINVHLLVCVRHAEPLANVTAVVLIIHVLVHLIDTWH